MTINKQALLADHTGTDEEDWLPVGEQFEHKRLWMLGQVTLTGTRVKVEVESTDPDSPEPVEGYEGGISEPYLKKFLTQ